MEQLMAEEREKHEEQLKLETRAREELEDMILRIEKHFKAEQVPPGSTSALLFAMAASISASRFEFRKGNMVLCPGM
eukprot:1158963-Pelagomonas_calceolata.AAC.8